MLTGLRLENLAQVIHTDKARTFTQERFVRQLEATQGRAYAAASTATWWAKIRRMTGRPLRLMVQWA